MISMYLLGMGEFGMDGYSTGQNVYTSFFFFIFGTFLVLLVFMNMLIAIMGDTFGTVQEVQDELALMEQCVLMGDFIWLLDLKEEFLDQRHIIILTPDMSITENGGDISQEISSLGTTILKKADSHNTQLLKRLESFEKNSRLLTKAQQFMIVNKVKQFMAEQWDDQKEYINQQLKAQSEKKEGEEEAE
jgi:hypothetical protein